MFAPTQTIIADHTLIDYQGHSFEYARSLTSQFQEQGCRVRVLATRWVSQDVIREVQAVPCFSYGYYHRFRLAPLAILPGRWAEKLEMIWNQRRHGQTLCRDIRRATDGCPMDRNTLVLMPTAGFNDILPFVRWAESFPAAQCPRFGLVFHFTAYPEFYDPPLWADLYRRAFRRLERSSARERFRLFTDSQGLADEYRDYTTLPVHVLPVPHSCAGEADPADGKREQSPDGHQPICVSYIGDARVNKGFHLLPAVVDRLRGLLERGEVRAEFQANIRNRAEQAVVTAVDSMAARPGVTLHYDPLDSDAYYSLLRRSDIVVLPYVQNRYHSQTSGVFTEALSLGKPVVVPRGTWMAAELKEGGAGVEFLPGDRSSLSDAVCEAIERHRVLRAQGTVKAGDWRRRHNPRTYLKELLSAFRPA